MRAVLEALGEQARTWLREEGVSETAQTVRFEADVRYLRQGYEFSLDVTPDPLANGGREALHERFGARHEQLYGFRLDHPVELVNLRAVGAASVTKVDFPRSSGAIPTPATPWPTRPACTSAATSYRRWSTIVPDCVRVTSSGGRPSSRSRTPRPSSTPGTPGRSTST